MTKTKNIYNYTARMHDKLLNSMNEKNALNQYNFLYDESINSSLHYIKAHLNTKMTVVEIYSDFYNEINTLKCKKQEDVDFVLKNISKFMKTDNLEENDYKKTLDILFNMARFYGNTYPVIRDEEFIAVRYIINNLHIELDNIVSTESTLNDLSFISQLHRNIIVYNDMGFRACKTKTESSFILFLGKLKLMHDKYEKFKTNVKILPLILDLLSLLSSLGLLSNLSGIGSSIVKLFPNYEHLNKATMDEIANLVNIS